LGVGRIACVLSSFHAPPGHRLMSTMGILADVGELIASVGSVACCAPPLPMRKPDKILGGVFP
jgi:hypothetical protein